MLLEILGLLFYFYYWMRRLRGEDLLPDTNELKDLLGQVTVIE